MFSQASVILSTGEGACMAGGCAWPGGIYGTGWVVGGGACMAGGLHGKGGGVCVAGGGRAWQDGHCSGQYASYWNAFLLKILILLTPIFFHYESRIRHWNPYNAYSCRYKKHIAIIILSFSLFHLKTAMHFKMSRALCLWNLNCKNYLNSSFTSV